jgi:hypothetical protein
MIETNARERRVMLTHIDTLPTPWEPAAVRADLLLGTSATIALSPRSRKGPAMCSRLTLTTARFRWMTNGKIAVKVSFEEESIVTLAYPAR